jgi:hypothetical protein
MKFERGIKYLRSRIWVGFRSHPIWACIWFSWFLVGIPNSLFSIYLEPVGFLLALGNSTCLSLVYSRFCWFRMILWASNSLSVISLSPSRRWSQVHNAFNWRHLRDNCHSTASDILASNSSRSSRFHALQSELTKLNGYKFMTHGGRNPVILLEVKVLLTCPNLDRSVW